MSVRYKAVGWNRQKKLYDRVLASGVVVYLLLFIGISAVLHPTATAETLLIRSTGTAAIILLHVILAIGPLCRIAARYLPLLYNRRHLGVMMFLLSLIHGALSTIQFHALGDANPIVSIFFAHTDYDSLIDFPFQTLGFLALIIFFLMAATSHDFWLATLTPPIWKGLHMLVYFAYGLVIMHVALGVLQDTRNPGFAIAVGIGLIVILGLHLIASRLPSASPLPEANGSAPAGYEYVGQGSEIPVDRAKTIVVGGERVAVYRVGNPGAGEADSIHAVESVCRHQNGPLGEGRIVDGCITCPWHGFQYDPTTGKSPPPFSEQIRTFPVHLDAKQRIYIQLSEAAS